MTEKKQDDLNQIIVSAVNARIESAVIAAFSGDEVIGRMVGAAMNEEIEVKQDKDYYSSRRYKTTFIKHTIATSIQEATQKAVKRLIADQSAEIEAAVQAELKRQVKPIAAQMVGKLNEAVKDAYGVTVSLRYPGQD